MCLSECWKEKAGPKRCDEVRVEQDLYGVYSVLGESAALGNTGPKRVQRSRRRTHGEGVWDHVDNSAALNINGGG